MSKLTSKIIKAVKLSKLSEEDIVSAINNPKPTAKLETVAATADPADKPKMRRTYSRRDMTAEPV